MSTTQGKFVWYDLMTSDSKAAESFYRSVIGWDAKDSGMADRSYTLFSAGPMMVGGMMPMLEEARAIGARPAWNGYVLIDDVDIYAERVKAAGGAIHRAPEDVPGVGRFSVAADPHGAVFNLFETASDEERAPAAPGTPGHVGWHELHAGDGPSAFAFYSGLFGWTKAEAMDMGSMGRLSDFHDGRCAVRRHDDQDAANTGAFLALLFQCRFRRGRYGTGEGRRRPNHPWPNAGPRR